MLNLNSLASIVPTFPSRMRLAWGSRHSHGLERTHFTNSFSGKGHQFSVNRSVRKTTDVSGLPVLLPKKDVLARAQTCTRDGSRTFVTGRP